MKKKVLILGVLAVIMGMAAVLRKRKKYAQTKRIY